MRTQLHSSKAIGARVGVLAAGLLLSTGCAGVTRVAPGDAQRPQIGSTQTVGGFSQQELGVAVEQSSGGAGFGLIGALVDAAVTSSRAKAGEGAVVPLRNALIGYEPGAALSAALKRELAPISWLGRNAVETRVLADSKSAVADLVRESKADFVLLVQTDYRLTPAFEALVITAKVSLLPRGGALPAGGGDSAAGSKPVYFNILTASVARPGSGGRELAVPVWAENGGRYARKALDGGMAELARMIAFDIAQGSPAGAGYASPQGARTMAVVGKYGTGKASGFTVREENGRAWVRLRSGELTAVGGLYP